MHSKINTVPPMIPNTIKAAKRALLLSEESLDNRKRVHIMMTTIYIITRARNARKKK